MPADDDYGTRRQVLLHPASASPAPAERFSSNACPAGCPAAPSPIPGSERLHPDRYSHEATSQDRGLPSFQTALEKADAASSERLHERYQGVSERYPLGERPQAAISSERLISNDIGDRHYQQRYSQNVGSLDRYHQIERYTPTDRRLSNTPTERYHEKERSSSSTDRYTPIERYADKYGTSERSKDYGSGQGRERCLSSDRYQHNDRYHSGRYQTNEHYAAPDRFPTIPCPDRFASQERPDRPYSSQERLPYTQVPYIPPPSPAPASDRFIPPPPLSPTNTPSPDCFPSNPFPSPTSTVPQQERFIPPPPLSPSPTEAFSPRKEPRYPDRYVTSPKPSDRYAQYPERCKDRYNTISYQSYHSHPDRYQDR